MKTGFTIMAGAMCLGFVCFSCSKKQEGAPPPAQETETAVTERPFYAADLLPGDMDTLEIKLLSPVKKLMRADADSILDLQAKQYLSFNLVGMATTEYEVSGVMVSAEVAQFASPEDAYGFYADLRPVGVGVGGLGTESFTLGRVRYFTRGEFVVTLSIDQEDSMHIAAQSLLGQEINGHIPDPPTPPPFFMLFPFADKIALSNKYYSCAFLGVVGLGRIYTTDYLTGGDTATLFLTVDKSGDKFLKLREYAASIGDVSSVPAQFVFDNGYSISFKHPSEGMIVAGLVQGKLVGVIGYDSTKNDRLASTWVQGLK
jgi:hypothetical protein